MVITFQTEEELARWGEEMGQKLSSNSVVFLNGPMGAGKTTLVRAMSKGYGVPEAEVSSPTFAIHNHMMTVDGKSVHHMDGYRIEDALEYEQVGLDMLPPGPVFVEWPDHCDMLKPTVIIHFEIKENGQRQLTVE